MGAGGETRPVGLLHHPGLKRAGKPKAASAKSSSSLWGGEGGPEGL